MVLIEIKKLVLKKLENIFILLFLFSFANNCLLTIASAISWLETSCLTRDSAFTNLDIFEKCESRLFFPCCSPKKFKSTANIKC